jgi:pimeloyl-ACP methyl ester carboxylesterase
MGLCIGGRVAMKFASMYPHRIDSLILLEAPVGEFSLPYVDEMIPNMDKLCNMNKSQVSEALDILYDGEGQYKEECGNPYLRGWIESQIVYDAEDKMGWKVNFDAISKNYLTNLKYMEPNFKY